MLEKQLTLKKKLMVINFKPLKAFLDDNYKEGYGKYRVKLCFVVCGAPKRRFREYMPAVAKNDNDTDARKARKTQIQRDEAIGYA
jgi:hypothetical protein